MQIPANQRVDIFAIAWHVWATRVEIAQEKGLGAYIHTHVEREREVLLDYSAARYKWKKNYTRNRPHAAVI
jgi:hypothetical protein